MRIQNNLIQNSKLRRMGYQQANIDDSVLVRGILDGQTGLFRLLAERYAGRMMGMIRRLVPAKEDAEEVTQDALLEAYKSLSRFDSQQSNLLTWLLSIAYHMALKHYRKASPKASPKTQDLKFVDTNQAWLENLADDEVDELLADTSADRLSLLEQAISQLKPDDQMLLSLFYYDNYSIKDISQITGHEGGYLRSRLQWIRKKLAKMIEC